MCFFNHHTTHSWFREFRSTFETINFSAVLKTNRVQISNICKPFWNIYFVAKALLFLKSKALATKYFHTISTHKVSLKWHLVRGNRVRNDRDRKPETRQMRSPKVALFENSYGQCAVHLGHCGIHDITDDEHSLCWFNASFQISDSVRSSPILFLMVLVGCGFINCVASESFVVSFS